MNNFEDVFEDFFEDFFEGVVIVRCGDDDLQINR